MGARHRQTSKRNENTSLCEAYSWSEGLQENGEDNKNLNNQKHLSSFIELS